MILGLLILAFMGFLTLFSLFLGTGAFIFMLLADAVLMLLSVRIIYEYQRGVVFTLGRYAGMLNPGLKFIIPFIQWARIVDLRLHVADVPEQQPITKDNVSVTVDAVIYYRIMGEQAQDSIIKVEDYEYAISQLAQTTMRNVVGEITLDEILSNREEASKRIKLIVDKASDPWGIKVDAVELKHVELPEGMKKVMAKAAEAERIKRASIIRASGEAAASKVISKAAETIGSVEGGLNLRTLQGLGNLASDQSNEVVFFVPLDVIRPIEGYKKGRKK